MNILKIEDLRKDYDELQVKYGAKELDSIYNVMVDVKKILIYVLFL